MNAKWLTTTLRPYWTALPQHIRSTHGRDPSCHQHFRWGKRHQCIPWRLPSSLKWSKHSHPVRCCKRSQHQCQDLLERRLVHQRDHRLHLTSPSQPSRERRTRGSETGLHRGSRGLKATALGAPSTSLAWKEKEKHVSHDWSPSGISC